MTSQKEISLLDLPCAFRTSTSTGWRRGSGDCPWDAHVLCSRAFTGWDCAVDLPASRGRAGLALAPPPCTPLSKVSRVFFLFSFFFVPLVSRD